MKSIKEFVSLESFAAWVESPSSLGKGSNEVNAGLIEFLDANWAYLKPIDPLGYRINFATLWNKFCGGGKTELESYEHGWLCEKLLTFETLLNISLFDEKTSVEQKYDSFCRWADGGFVFTRKDICASDDCFLSGKKLYPVFDAPFSVVLHSRNNETRKLDPAQVYTPPGVQHVEFDCPSGQVIIADWIRIPELTKIYCDNQDYSSEFSINHEAGSIADTKRTLEKFGLLDLHLGNVSTEIFARDGKILIGDAWNEKMDDQVAPADYKNTGSVCTDRWSFVAIDRKNLEAILADVSKDPSTLIDEYLRSGESIVQSWRPGTYHVYFSGNYHKFGDEFSGHDFELPAEMKVYAVISDCEIALKSEAKPKPRARTPK